MSYKCFTFCSNEALLSSFIKFFTKAIPVGYLNYLVSFQAVGPWIPDHSHLQVVEPLENFELEHYHVLSENAVLSNWE